MASTIGGEKLQRAANYHALIEHFNGEVSEKRRAASHGLLASRIYVAYGIAAKM